MLKSRNEAKSSEAIDLQIKITETLKKRLDLYDASSIFNMNLNLFAM